MKTPRLLEPTTNSRYSLCFLPQSVPTAPTVTILSGKVRWYQHVVHALLHRGQVACCFVLSICEETTRVVVFPSALRLRKSQFELDGTVDSLCVAGREVGCRIQETPGRLTVPSRYTPRPTHHACFLPVASTANALAPIEYGSDGLRASPARWDLLVMLCPALGRNDTFIAVFL